MLPISSYFLAYGLQQDLVCLLEKNVNLLGKVFVTAFAVGVFLSGQLFMATSVDHNTSFCISYLWLMVI